MGAYEDGMRVRRRVLGDDHVDRATTRSGDLDEGFQRWITETAWAGVWARPGLDHRTRSLITIAILAVLGRDELDLHLQAAANTGATSDEIVETLFHVAVYAGVPAANSAFARLKAVVDERPR